MMKSLRAIAPSVIRDSIGIAGSCLIVYGAWLVYEPAGFLMAGLMLMTAALLAARTAK